jgi:hypothetical protein
MPISDTQIQIYALTKQLMDLSEKYILTILQSEKTIISVEINQLYKKMNDLELQLKDETK